MGPYVILSQPSDIVPHDYEEYSLRGSVRRDVLVVVAQYHPGEIGLFAVLSRRTSQLHAGKDHL
ncbi:MAG: hypothetical protein AAGJ80_09390 [Cyanobacteria bacterium J06553_1]